MLQQLSWLLFWIVVVGGKLGRSGDGDVLAGGSKPMCLPAGTHHLGTLAVVWSEEQCGK